MILCNHGCNASTILAIVNKIIWCMCLAYFPKADIPKKNQPNSIHDSLIKMLSFQKHDGDEFYSLIISFPPSHLLYHDPKHLEKKIELHRVWKIIFRIQFPIIQLILYTMKKQYKLTQTLTIRNNGSETLWWHRIVPPTRPKDISLLN